MVFKHYRQLVRESEAKEWFAIAPARDGGADIIPLSTRANETETREPAKTESQAAAANV